jgi:hypothetical protein
MAAIFLLTSLMTGAAQQNTAASHGTAEFNIVLDHPVDVKKAHVGDPVIAVTAVDLIKNGKAVIPIGSHLKGKVTVVQPRSAGHNESMLGIEFDELYMDSEHPYPVSVQIRAMSFPEEDRPFAPGIEGRGPGGSGSISSPDQARIEAANNGGIIGQLEQPNNPQLLGIASKNDREVMKLAPTLIKPGTTGVKGAKDIAIKSDEKKPEAGSIIASGKRDISLPAGTQMLIRLSNR